MIPIESLSQHVATELVAFGRKMVHILTRMNRYHFRKDGIRVQGDGQDWKRRVPTEETGLLKRVSLTRELTFKMHGFYVP